MFCYKSSVYLDRCHILSRGNCKQQSVVIGKGCTAIVLVPLVLLSDSNENSHILSGLRCRKASDSGSKSEPVIWLETDWCFLLETYGRHSAIVYRNHERLLCNSSGWIMRAGAIWIMGRWLNKWEWSQGALIACKQQIQTPMRLNRWLSWHSGQPGWKCNTLNDHIGRSKMLTGASKVVHLLIHYHLHQSHVISLDP